MAPRVSILIPCYNAGRWVRETIESALRQTWSNCEIIVVDDGSSDDSVVIARHFSPRGVRVLTQENRGAAAARNTAFRASTGTFIQFLDADDVLAPDKIERQMEILQHETEPVLCSGRWGRFTDSIEQADFRDEPNFRDLSGIEFLQIFYETSAMMQPAAWLSPRPLLEAIGPWDEKLSLNDDGEYFARAMLHAKRIRFCPAARVYYRSHVRSSLSRRRDPKAMQSLFQAAESTLSHLWAADQSDRTKAAVAYGWKWMAFELYPESPMLSRIAEQRSRSYGGSNRPLPAGPKFQIVARLLGWRLAKRWRRVP
jgi:glycosyltransferase involved in cell wall biosynthesis